MVKIRPLAEFHADFPEDAPIEGEAAIAEWGGPEVVEAMAEFGGRGVSQALAEIVRGLGYEVSPPRFAWEHGWEFSARSRLGSFWLQATDMSDKFILQTFDRAWRLWPDRSKHATFLLQLDEALRRDGRFSHLRWYAADYKDETCSELPVDR